MTRAMAGPAAPDGVLWLRPPRVRGLARLLPKVDVPAGRSGRWAVERFAVTPAQARRADRQLIVQWCAGRPSVVVPFRRCPPGAYTRLTRDDGAGPLTIMADTPQELADHAPFVRAARGRVLVGGLGLGAVAAALLARPAVAHVTVVERAADVLRLVAPHYRARFGTGRLAIVAGDATAWNPPPGARWDRAWWDIWDDVSPAHLPQMDALRARYAAWVDPARQACWGEETARAIAARGWTPADRAVLIG